jgi:hypothetical protein
MPTVFDAPRETGIFRTNILGMRLDFKPRAFQIAVNRVFMFGGDGRKSLTASGWVKVFLTQTRLSADSPISGNQIASIDASYLRQHFSASFLRYQGLYGMGREALQAAQRHTTEGPTWALIDGSVVSTTRA